MTKLSFAPGLVMVKVLTTCPFGRAVNYQAVDVSGQWIGRGG